MTHPFPVRLQAVTASAMGLLLMLAVAGCVPFASPRELSATRHIVKGHVLTTQGTPVEGAEVFADNLQFYDENVTTTTDNDGYYEISLSGHSQGSWRVGGYVTVSLGGEQLRMSLHPDAGGSFQASDGAVRNLEWRLSGSTIEGGHYGGEVWVYADTAGEYIDTDVVEITLTPVGQLIDGSQGEPMVTSARSNRIGDIPLGTYKVSAQHLDHEEATLLVRERDSGDYVNEVTVPFRLSQYGAPQIELEVTWP